MRHPGPFSIVVIFREGMPGFLEAFTLLALAGELALAANRFSILAGTLLGRLLVGTTKLHLAKHAFALHLLLQSLEGLIDIVVAYDDLDDGNHLLPRGSVRNA